MSPTADSTRPIAKNTGSAPPSSDPIKAASATSVAGTDATTGAPSQRRTGEMAGGASWSGIASRGGSGAAGAGGATCGAAAAVARGPDALPPLRRASSSLALCGRCRGSFARQAAMVSSQAGGMASAAARPNSRRRSARLGATRLCTWAITLPAWKGGLPVSRSYSVAPTA